MLMERVNSGDWCPPREATRPLNRQPPAEVPTYRHMAALCLRDWSLLIESDTSKTALVWQLNLFMDALGARPSTRSRTRDIRRAALDLRAERVAIEQARAEGAALHADNHHADGTHLRRRGAAASTTTASTRGSRRVARAAEAKTAGYIDEVPDIRPALLPTRKVRRSFLHPHQVAGHARRRPACSRQQHRGLDWDHVRYIRRSDKPAVALARELQVSDVLDRQGTARRGQRARPSNRNDIAAPRRARHTRAGRPTRQGALLVRRPSRRPAGAAPARPAIGTKSVAGVRMVPHAPRPSRDCCSTTAPTGLRRAGAGVPDSQRHAQHAQQRPQAASSCRCARRRTRCSPSESRSRSSTSRRTRCGARSRRSWRCARCIRGAPAS